MVVDWGMYETSADELSRGFSLAVSIDPTQAQLLTIPLRSDKDTSRSASVKIC